MNKQEVHVFVAHNAKASSCAFFKPHWICWKILGITLDIKRSQKHGNIYLFYGIALNIMVTIFYPLHLALHLFRSNTMADNIKNLAVCVTCMACSTKFIIYATKLQTIRKFEQILKRLDERIVNKRETTYFKRLRKRLCTIGLVFLSVYLPIGITAALSFIFRKERSLLYPAWFPFNWWESLNLFILANVYQVVGITILIFQNYVDDTYPSMALCMLSGHIKILSIRVAHLGYDEGKSLKENEEELKRCIVDQQRLYELFGALQNIISWPIFIQFSVSALNCCLGISALLFFASTPLDILYYFIYSLAMELQIFPTCYYGSDFQYQFAQLHRSIYASNWIEQSQKFKKHMILFTERSLKTHSALAGGMLLIHLDTFFATCRAAYSLLAVIMTMK